MTETMTFSTPLHEQALAIIAAELELAPEDFTLTGNLVEEYDADSLALISVAARFEKELKVVIPKTEFIQLTDLNSVFRMIDQYAGAPRG